MSESNARKGITLMIATMIIFALQDGLSRHLAAEYNTILIVMIRYWFFVLFVIALSATREGGLRRVAKTSQPVLQVTRGLLLAAEICVMVLAFVKLGLVSSHAIFASCPLIIAALSGPILGEKVGWRRWIAIGTGFGGVLIILRPGYSMFAPEALIAITATLLFALYSLLTRYAARKDSAETSFFWTGVSGAVALTIVGSFFWEPIIGNDWWLMGLLCLFGATGHYLLIKTYEITEASTVQPFAYFQLVFASIIGLTVFGEVVDFWIVMGVSLIIGSGLFTIWRERKAA